MSPEGRLLSSRCLSSSFCTATHHCTPTPKSEEAHSRSLSDWISIYHIYWILSECLVNTYWIKQLYGKVKVKSLSHVWLFATHGLVAHKAPLSMEFSRQEYWSGFPFPSPEDLPDQGSNQGIPHCRQMLYHLSLYCKGDIILWQKEISIYFKY